MALRLACRVVPCLLAVALLPATARAGNASVTETQVPLSTSDDPRKVAEAYLKAVAGEGDDKGRDHLLGGATMTAQIFTLANWKILSREAYRKENGDLADVSSNVEGIDKEGREALAKLTGGGPAGGGADEDGLEISEVSADQAKKLLEPTKAKAAAFQKSHPVFAYVARVDREVYWHPKNPFRKLLADAGSKGPYTLEFNLFWVETVEGLGVKTNRKWPLRVLRFKNAKLDTGWKVLPASDWNAE